MLSIGFRFVVGDGNICAPGVCHQRSRSAVGNEPKVCIVSACWSLARVLSIIAGALVTITMPGWQHQIGRCSMASFPKMVGNLFWEVGHRHVATTVGLLTIGLVIFLFAGEKRSWVRRLGLLALVGVIAQGLLGGLTVKLMLPLVVSAAHATLAQLFFCTTVSLAVFTSRSWIENRPAIEEQGGLPVRYLCVAAAATIFLQLIIGATLRHSATWDKPLPTDLLLTHVGEPIAVTLFAGRGRTDNPATASRHRVSNKTGEDRPCAPGSSIVLGTGSVLDPSSFAE